MGVQVGNPRLPQALGEPAESGQAKRKGDGASLGGERGGKRKTGKRGIGKGNGQQKRKEDGEATGC